MKIGPTDLKIERKEVDENDVSSSVYHFHILNDKAKEVVESVLSSVEDNLKVVNPFQAYSFINGKHVEVSPFTDTIGDYEKYIYLYNIEGNENCSRVNILQIGEVVDFVVHIQHVDTLDHTKSEPDPLDWVNAMQIFNWLFKY